MVTTRSSHRIGACVALGLLAVSCSGGEPASDAPSQAPEGSGELRSITVAETTGLPSAFLTYGVQEGYFEEEGLDVTVDTSAGGAAAIPGLVNGSLQVAGSNVVSVLLAAQQGLPLKIVAPGTGVGDDLEQDFSRVMVLADSPIQAPEDLADANVSVNTLENISEVSVRGSLENLGVDTSAMTFTELGFPDMLPALERGDIDAAFLIEPFATLAAEQGARGILSPYVGLGPNSQIGSYVMTAELAESDPELVAAFQAGVAATAESVTADEQAFREALPEIASLDPALIDEIQVPVWTGTVDRESLESIGEWMIEFDIMPAAPDYDTVVLD